MGMAALDLPDPLEAPPEGPKGSTDDLLAQLAGDEIDRLLAEADAGPAVSQALPPIAPTTAAAQDALPERVAAPAPSGSAPPESPAPPPKPSEAREEISAELDALFSQAVTSEAPAADASAPVTNNANGSPSGAVTDAAMKAEAEAELDAATIAAERDGLKTPVGASPLHATHSKAAAALNVEDENAPLPLYLRPLEWLNAPLALFPESVRDLIGKAAIVTLLNAAAILAYVLVVRRGH